MIRYILGILAIGVLTTFAFAQQITPPGQVGVACAYNSAPPTITTGNYGLVQCDSTGKLSSGLPAVQSAPGTPQTTALTVQGNASGIALPTSIQGSSLAANANSHAATSALAASFVLKASAGNLYSVNATSITGGATGFLVVVDATSAPANGAITPLDFCAIVSVVGCSLSHGTIPIRYSTGIVALITTAASPYTYTSGVNTAAISGDYQ